MYFANRGIYIYIGHWTGVEGQRKKGKPNGNV